MKMRNTHNITERNCEMMCVWLSALTITLFLATATMAILLSQAKRQKYKATQSLIRSMMIDVDSGSINTTEGGKR